MIKFDIKNRFTGAVQFTAEIDCADDASTATKLGPAVRWAVKARANLAGANLAGANLTSAYLVGANLFGANLVGANLADANLVGANLAGANLFGANFEGANLTRAYLFGANLTDANFEGAYFEGANLDGSKIVKLVARATRSDGYEFFGWLLDDGGLLIRARGRTMTLAEYRVHVGTYGTRADAATKARETTDILDFIERRASA